jgi:hypothetical protein
VCTKVVVLFVLLFVSGLSAAKRCTIGYFTGVE